MAGQSLVGDDGLEAAWTLALHTMHDPKVLRRCLTLLQGAAAAGEAEPWQVAVLVDRVSLVERNVQVYGTTICRQQAASGCCWRRLTGWANAGVVEQLHLQVLDRLGEQGRLDSEGGAWTP